MILIVRLSTRWDPRLYGNDAPPLRCIAALNIWWDTPVPHLLIAVCTAFDRTKTREAS